MDIKRIKEMAELESKPEYERYAMLNKRDELLKAEARLIPNSAYGCAEQMQRLNDLAERNAERQAQKDAALFRTADEAEAQTELLKEQLQKANERNELLQKSYTELEKANEQLKEEAAANRIEREESRKEAKKARRLTVAAFVLSIVFPIVSIVASVLIALYL